MAADSTVEVKFKVTEDGKIDKIAKDSEKAAKGTDNAARSAGHYQKKQKGVAGATANGTKAFSKMTEGINGGLVPAYAEIAARVFALTAIFSQLKNAFAVEQLEEGFTRLGNAAGVTATSIAKTIKAASGEAVSLEAALRATAAGFTAGFSTAEMEGLTKIARGASVALGRDLGDALDRLIRGTAKLEPEILDELGIFVRLDDAVNEYATSLGKASTALTESERRQAFLNKALTQGLRKFGDIADIEANPFNKLYANFEEMRKGFMKVVNFIAGPIANLLANSMLALVGTFAMFGAGIAKHIFPSLTNMGDKFKEAAVDSLNHAKEALDKQQTIVKAAQGTVMGATVSGKDTKFSKVRQKMLDGEKVSLAELKVAQKSLSQSETRRAANLTKGNVKNVAEKERELELIREQKRAVDKLILAEQGRDKLSATVGVHTRAGEAEDKLGTTIGDIGGAGAYEGFGKANKGFKEYKEGLDDVIKSKGPFMTKSKALNKIMTKVRPILMTASAGVRLFGAAVLNAIPIIGQILFVVGLLVQGAVSLYKALNKPTEAEKRLEEQTESLNEKMKQLAETNKGLVNKFRQLEIAEYNKNVSAQEANMTIEQSIQKMIELNQAAAKSADIHAFANNLKVASGVTAEFTSNVALLSAELTSNQGETETGFLKGILVIAKDKAMKKLGEIIQGIADAVGNLAEALKKGGKFVQEVFARIISTIGEFTPAPIKEVAGAVVQSANEIVDSVTTATANIEESKIADAWVSGVSDNFAMLVKEAKGLKIAEAYDDQFKNQFAAVNAVDFEDYLVKGMNEALKEGGVGFEAFKALVLAGMTNVERKTKKASDAINDFGDNVKKGQAAVTKFNADMVKKNPFETLTGDIQSTLNAVIDLEELATDSGKYDFASLMIEQVKAGNIDLKRFGLSLEDIKEKGSAAFTPLISKTKEVAQSFTNSKNELQKLKAVLQTLKLDFKNKKLEDTLRLQLETLKQTGKFEQTTLQKHQQSNVLFQERMDFIDEEAKKKKAIIDKETELEILKLDLAILLNKYNEDQLKNLQKQRAIYVDMGKARKDVVDKETKGGKTQARIDFHTTRQGVRDSILGGIEDAGSLSGGTQKFGQFISTAQTDKDGNTMEGTDAFTRMTSDKDGNVSIAEDQSGAAQERLAAMKTSMSDMLETLKELGPEGVFAATIAEANFTIADSFLDMTDTMGQGLKETAGKAQFAADAIGAVASVMAARSKAKIAGIDKEIEAEKKRDGQSAGSIAKLQALEKKKDRMKRKEFEQNKKMQMAQIVANTAAGVMGVWSGVKDPYVGPNLATLAAGTIIALGAMQLATVAGTSYDGGGSINSSTGKVEVGSRQNTVDLGRANNAAGELAYARGADGVGTGMGDYRPAFSGYKHRAEGGYVVGEQGPELFMPETPGTIVPAGESEDMLGSAPTNVNFTIQTIDSQNMEEALTSQRGNIISMIREAANANGEFFMEGIE